MSSFNVYHAFYARHVLIFKTRIGRLRSHYFFLGSANAIITLVNGGASVESQDEDGLTGKCKQMLLCT